MSEDIKSLTRKAAIALNQQAWPELEVLAKQMLAVDRNQADPWFLLSVTATERRRIKVAIDLINQAVALSPGNVEYLAQQARANAMAGQREPALAAANQALALKPEAPVILDTLGVVFSRFDMHREARAVFDQGVRLMPGNAQFQFNLASAEQFLGNADAALRHYQLAIKARPDFYRAYWALSELEKNRTDPARLNTLEQLWQDQRARSAEDRLYLGHAIAREYEKAGDFDAAFTHLALGKRAMRQKIDYELAADQKLFAAMKSRFPIDSLDQPSGESGAHNIFVLGMPRSGTTLVDRILSSHSRVSSMGEIQEMARAVKNVVASTSPVLLDAETIELSNTADVKEIGRRYLYNIGQRLDLSDLSLDKMPLNFFYVGFILNALPAAKIVCVRRHPVDVCLSNYRQLFALNFSYYNYHYDLNHTAEYYALFDDLMAHWRAAFPGRFFEISYEALVADPEPEVRKMCDHIGIEFEPACLEFYKSDAAVSTASAIQVREPLYNSAIDRWKQYGDHLNPVLETLKARGIQY